jgi:hypothetical protein
VSVAAFVFLSYVVRPPYPRALTELALAARARSQPTPMSTAPTAITATTLACTGICLPGWLAVLIVPPIDLPWPPAMRDNAMPTHPINTRFLRINTPHVLPVLACCAQSEEYVSQKFHNGTSRSSCCVRPNRTSVNRRRPIDRRGIGFGWLQNAWLLHARLKIHRGGLAPVYG